MKPTATRITLSLLFILFFAGTLFAQPPNNNCANASLITTDSACVTGTSRLINQTLSLATGDGGTITTTCTAVASQDVWYRFVAKTPQPTITVSSLGSSWGTTLKIQLLSGSCGAFTEVACANNAPVTPSLANQLIPGNTYYIRVHKNNTTAPSGSNWGFSICVTDPLSRGGRMNEVFSRTILSAASVLNYPWEVTYGPDNNLWVTESKGYRVYRINPTTGVRTTVLDISQNSTFLPLADRVFNCQFANGSGAQGGLAGLALHPKFLDPTTPENYVYVSYVYSSNGGSSPTGIFFTNRLVRFTYNTGTGLLESPVSLCDTLPGSSDHNSQRIIIAPVTPGGTNYLFYASGDMGSGQFGNRTRPQRAQSPTSYEGKILRFNVAPDGDAGLAAWIPNDNPYSATSAVYSIGIRNNQGFAYDTALNILYGASHGAYSDDEINIIEGFKNYGHPLIIGYAADGNYNGNPVQGTNTSVSAGAPFPTSSGVSSCPPVGNEANNAIAINAGGNGLYKDPLFSGYISTPASILNIWQTNPGNAGWPSEGWSGLDLYSNKMIPGWKKSLVTSGLKWGRLIKLRLGSAGTTTLPSNLSYGNTGDTVTYFQSTNRYRDLAFAPNGKDIFLVMDNSSATSGPGVGNPTVPACPGCVLKYTFLGYADAAGFSTIPKSIGVTDGPTNTCNPGTTITIDGTNNYLWVPITGPDGNILAEINAMGQNLGQVTSSFYINSGGIRANGGVHYLDRNITITPAVTSFGTPVKVRLYISKAEFDALVADPLSGVGAIGQLKVLKNDDACGSAIASYPALLNPTNTVLSDLQHGADGYVLQVNVTGFSSFYFAASNATLPFNLITFTGSLENKTTSLLKWKTANETNTSSYVIERSADGQNFNPIGTVAASGNTSTEANYNFRDPEVANEQSLNVFYRLKMFDLNGTYRYSNVVKVTLPGIQNDMTISPNPAVTDVKASVTSAEDCDAEWQVIDAAGRVLLKNSVSLRKGNNDLNINMSQIPSGTYYLKIKGTCIELRSKFQKL